MGEVLHIKGIPIPYGAPNAAAHIERFMGSLKRECLNHFLFMSDDHLRRTVVAYIAYYNEGRPHQGIEGIPEFGPGLPRATLQETGAGPIKAVAHPVLGGPPLRLPPRRLGPSCPKTVRLASPIPVGFGHSLRAGSCPRLGSNGLSRTPYDPRRARSKDIPPALN